MVPALLRIGEVMDDPLLSDRETTVTRTSTVDEVTVETVEEPNDASPFERAVAGGGLLLVRLTAVAAAGFVAGAVVQRILLGKFAFKAGTFELPDVGDVATATEEAIAALKADLAHLEHLAHDTARVSAMTSQRVADLLDQGDAGREGG